MVEGASTRSTDLRRAFRVLSVSLISVKCIYSIASFTLTQLLIVLNKDHGLLSLFITIPPLSSAPLRAIHTHGTSCSVEPLGGHSERE